MNGLQTSNAVAVVPFVVVRPRGGGADDGPRLAAALAATAAVGGYVQLVGGTYTIITSVAFVPYGMLVGTPGTTLNFTLATGGNSHFGFAYGNNNTDPTVTSTTLNTTAVEGSHTIVSVGPVTPGKWIAIQNTAAANYQIFQVLASSGSGPYTLTVDEPVRWPFQSTGAIFGVLPLFAPRIIGNGMLVTGTCDRIWEWNYAIDGIVSDFRAVGTFAWGAGGMDLGGRHNRVEKLEVTIATTSGQTAGIGLEGQVGSSVYDCSITFTGTSASLCGAFVSGSWGCSVDKFRVEGAFVSGVLLNSQSSAATDFGSNDCKIANCWSTGATTSGFAVQDNSFRNVFANCTADFGVLDGFTVLAGGSASPTDTALVGCVARANGRAGINVGAGPSATTAIGFSTTANGQYGCYVTSDLQLVGYTGYDNAGQFDLYVGGAANLQIVGGKIHLSSPPAASSWYGLYTLNGATGRVSFSGGTRIEMPVYSSGNGTFGVVVQGVGVVSLGDAYILNGEYGVFSYSGSTVRYGSTLSISTAGTALSLSGTTSSWGTAGTL